MPRKTGVQASLATHDMPGQCMPPFPWRKRKEQLRRARDPHCCFPVAGSRPPSRLDARPGSVSPTPTPRPATATAAGPGPTPRVARPASAPRLAVATPRGAEVARSAGLLRPSTARGQGAKGSGAGVRGGGGAATTDAKPAQLSARCEPRLGSYEARPTDLVVFQTGHIESRNAPAGARGLRGTKLLPGALAPTDSRPPTSSSTRGE